MTIEQIKTDIATLKSHRIYYSSGSLWWTHLDSDVKEATEMGTARQITLTKMRMETASISGKAQLKEYLAILQNSEHTVPCDPTGAPLFQMDDCNKWISAAEEKPGHFGKHGLAAFIKAHHQNNEGKIPLKTWSEYNDLLDRIKAK